MINLACFDYIKQYCNEHYEGFYECIERLGLSEESFFRKIARNFDSYKVNFLNEDDRSIEVRSRIGSPTIRKFLITK